MSRPPRRSRSAAHSIACAIGAASAPTASTTFASSEFISPTISSGVRVSRDSERGLRDSVSRWSSSVIVSQAHVASGRQLVIPGVTGSAPEYSDRPEKTRLAMSPTANTVNEPTRANHGQASGVPNLAKVTAETPATTPTSAADCPTRRVRIPSRNRPSRMPETKEAIARALFTTLSSSRRAPKATAVRTQPQSTVISRETRTRCRSSRLAGEGPVQVVHDRRRRRVERTGKRPHRRREDRGDH